jgi:glycosyltransferase involved in cell wall biosynthesis
LKITAAVIAKDEAHEIEACIRSVSFCDEVLVLDSGSADGTPALARSLGARVVETDWPGYVAQKNRAAAMASHDWVLSIDADARPDREAIARALAAARDRGLAAVSLAARQRVGSLGEGLLTPLVFALLDALLGDWSPVARGEGRAVANGQFFLFHRGSLLLAGGFEALSGEPLDDVAMARLLAARGLRVGFWRAREALAVRMYAGFAATFGGWRRNLALVLGTRRGLVAGAVALALAPLLAAAAGAAAGERLAVLIAWAGGAAASVVARAGTGSSPLLGLLYPLDALALSSCLLAAARDRARGRLASWRGRPLEAGPHP